MSRPAYFIAHYDVTDPDRYEQEYVPRLVAQLAEHGADIVVATGSGEVLEGEAGRQVVVLRFPSQEALREWYEGRDHAPLKELRFDTTAGTVALAAREYRRPPD